ncbi:AraC family transcriptional regulator [Butyricicoccus sp. AM29-23AC]|nr:AraC family transcriptional regulator [Butyricicoccus sp. AM29-23AC]
MDAARREKKEHGTLSFPFQIYPALDGSEADDSDFIPYHWHPELEIITVDCGRVSLTIADRMYEAPGETYSSRRPRSCMRYAPPDEKTSSARSSLRRIFCSSPVPTRPSSPCSSRSRRDGCGSRPVCGRASRGRGEVRTLLAQIVRTWQQQRPAVSSPSRRRCSASSRSARSTAGWRGGPCVPVPDYRARQLREIVGYLGEHFTEPLSLPEVASHFGLSPQYFSTFFRENFGRTFTQHINSLRIEQAARLLRETDLPVMEVGFSVGFDNFSYFIKRFRSVYGVSPSHYRKG